MASGTGAGSHNRSSDQSLNWLFHAVLPFVAYATLSASACAASAHPAEAMFGVATAALLLLFTGIHNAWDAVTYHVFVKKREHNEAEQPR